ncbi:hypothetical protein HMI54_003997 [Coelomomyces lativittatus]|nr:hypothetical protein HMI55_005647 [Coelomomyces lativittatus]KAJ1503995.1 hypothetical protein HMI56_001849 [Coelomomyces lativittatus]KAJ1507583.1 hypothetical protein HMI54_003997 [Coelomomyces lativittatus]
MVCSNIVRSVTEFLELYLPQLEMMTLNPPVPKAPSPSIPTAMLKHPYLDALVEQYTQVEAFLKDAQFKRKLDQVKSLTLNLEELKSEIHRIHDEIQDSFK